MSVTSSIGIRAEAAPRAVARPRERVASLVLAAGLVSDACGGGSMPLLAVRRVLQEEAPEGAHHPAQGLLRRRSRVDRAALVPLLQPVEDEPERLVGGEERPQRLAMAVHLVHRANG